MDRDYFVYIFSLLPGENHLSHKLFESLNTLFKTTQHKIDSIVWHHVIRLS